MQILVITPLPKELEVRAAAIDPSLRVFRAEPGEALYERLLPEVEIIHGRPPVDDLARAGSLRWLQLASAGADRYVGKIPCGIRLTSASGVFGIPCAEHVFAMMLALTRRIPDAVLSSAMREWAQATPLLELFERTCGILGFGDIGSEVACRAKAFGMRVLVFRRSRSRVPAFVDGVFDQERLMELLKTSDHIVNTLPATEATRRLMDRDAFGAMKRGSYFYNIGRGSTVDEEALIEALDSGHLAGAGLDVFASEPLSSESPLWNRDNVIITPHVGGSSPREAERETQLFLRNLQHFLSGQPLENEIEAEKGY